MTTTMDIQDLLLTAEESLEELAAAIEALALDSVYAYAEDGELRVQINDESRILAKANPDTGELVLDASGRRFHFYWDAVEEAWYTKDNEYPLAPVVEKILSEHTGNNVRLNLDA